MIPKSSLPDLLLDEVPHTWKYVMVKDGMFIFFWTVVPQSVSIRAEGLNGRILEVVANLTIVLQCVVVRARPAAILSWDSEPAVGTHRRLALTAQPASVEAVGQLSNSTGFVSIRPTPDDDQTTVRCLATNDATGPLLPVAASIQISVVCKLTITEIFGFVSLSIRLFWFDFSCDGFLITIF